MPLQKATMSSNPYLMQNQRFVVEGLPSARIITRDKIKSEIDKIERPDKTIVPSGRLNPGTFNITLDFADNEARSAFINWKNMAIDSGQGVNPQYKKSATIVFGRLFADSTGTDKELKQQILGCFPLSASIPEYDMDKSEACILEMEISYDDAPMTANG